MNNFQPTRRRVLHGIGAALAVPFFDSLPQVGNPTTQKDARLAVGKKGQPLRMAFVAIPNGAMMEPWRARGDGRQFQFGETLEVLKPLRDKVQQFTGYAQDGARAHGDGAGDHARANATFLTGVHIRKTAGADIKAGVSVDQIAARKVGHLTRIASLELGTERSRKTGSCDSGYSCAYQYNLSWATETLPMAAEADPRLVFERLFGTGKGDERDRNLQVRLASRRSVIDMVLEDARTLKRELGVNDKRKLDEYLSSIRSVEETIEKNERFSLPQPDMQRPDGIPKDYKTHIRLMYELMALAFQTDSTRIATFLCAHDGSNRSFKEIGIPEGHHDLSHHQLNKTAMEKVAKIDRFYSEQFAWFLQRLDELKDADGSSLLDNSMVIYGGATSDGNRHRHEDLPILLAGKGGGHLNAGRHVRVKDETPLNNLYLGMLEHMGANPGKFGDSTAVETDL